MEWLWMLEFLQRQQQRHGANGQECSGGFCSSQQIWKDMLKMPSDWAIAMQAAGGDLTGAATAWAMRQTAPWLTKGVTTGLTKLGLSSGTAAAVAPFLAVAALSGLARLFRRRTAQPSDTNYMMNLQRQQALMNAADQTIREATDIGARRAQNMMAQARQMAGGNQYLGALLAQGAAPAAADAAAEIVGRGLQARAGMLESALNHERQRQLQAQQFAQNLTLAQIEEQARRRQMMQQLMLTMAVRGLGGNGNS